MNTRKYFTLFTLILFGSVLMLHEAIVSADKKPLNPDPVALSKAYAGHDHDKQKDIANLMAVHPELAGTVLDDCRLCHRDGVWQNNYENHCDYCHASRHTLGFTQTLNAYGTDYATNGRSKKALNKIKGNDSDGDGTINSDEYRALTQPGEAGSRPNLIAAPNVILTPDNLQTLTKHSQFLLLNAHRKTDMYATYTGWTLETLLKHVNGFEKATHITVICQDGFRKDYSRDEIIALYPQCTFYGGMDQPDFLGDCPVIARYPNPLPSGIITGKPIPGNQRLILASHRDTRPLVTLHRDPESNKLVGEGPYRVIMPQKEDNMPDQSMFTSDPKWPNPFTEAIHHNSGDCARGIIAIAVHPLPAGTKEPDWQSRSDELLQSGSLMLFGEIKVETPLTTNRLH